MNYLKKKIPQMKKIIIQFIFYIVLIKTQW